MAAREGAGFEREVALLRLQACLRHIPGYGVRSYNSQSLHQFQKKRPLSEWPFFETVEAAGIEPASAHVTPKGLHAYLDHRCRSSQPDLAGLQQAISLCFRLTGESGQLDGLM